MEPDSRNKLGLVKDLNEVITRASNSPCGNVLLDQDLTAHVADFGIAKMLAEEGNIAQTKTLGTISYIAPALKTRAPNCVRSEKAAMGKSVKFEGISEELQKIIDANMDKVEAKAYR
uniref:Protein kinase domain-containing protein n=1 Tax=Solanum lycopersicum TaxID=4081 RepID=A0A3Q7F0V8_SOLLC